VCRNANVIVCEVQALLLETSSAAAVNVAPSGAVTFATVIAVAVALDGTAVTINNPEPVLPPQPTGCETGEKEAWIVYVPGVDGVVKVTEPGPLGGTIPEVFVVPKALCAGELRRRKFTLWPLMEQAVAFEDKVAVGLKVGVDADTVIFCTVKADVVAGLRITTAPAGGLGAQDELPANVATTENDAPPLNGAV